MSQQQSADWVRLAQSPSRTERIEAVFGGHGYEPHRHDTYAIGQTIAGVQSFHYRGGLQHSLPGDAPRRLYKKLYLTAVYILRI